MNDIVSYIRSKGINFKQEGSEIVIRCPTCNKEKLYINLESGLYHCFYCEANNPSAITAGGHISRLKEVWGDIIPISPISTSIARPNKNQKEVNFSDKLERYHYDLLKNKKAIKYLLKRGISEESINRFKLGFTRRYGQDWLVLPSFEDKIPKLLKFRKLPPDENKELEKYIREEGSKSILFNGDIIKDYDEIYITEGEIDAITLIQQGYENVIGITGGAGTLLPTWYDKLILKEKLFLILDSDSAGQNAARDVWATRLGINKCWNVSLPEKEDINSFFKKYTKDKFDNAVKEAQRFKVEGISSLSEALYELYRKSKDKDALDTYPLPWESVNRLLGGGLTKKRLTVLGGPPKTGKTSFAMQICYHFAKEYKIPSLLFCLEMPETSLATKIVQLDRDLRIEEVKAENAQIYASEIGDLPIYFGYQPKIKPDVFYNTMKEVRNRYGVELGVFDNLQIMVRTGEEADIGNASKMFKDLAMELNIMFILISQPRKLGGDDMTYYDLKGSSAIPADSDEVILMQRKRLTKIDERGSFDPVTKIIVDASRFAPGGRCNLYMEGAKSKFIEYKELSNS